MSPAEASRVLLVRDHLELLSLILVLWLPVFDRPTPQFDEQFDEGAGTATGGPVFFCLFHPPFPLFFLVSS